ncbi:YdjY domain-containing protein [Akkermansiaceae bacterium]|nr:YdjY domain-containing protein [Akkermansiaceae bacterium]MDB4287296.1 YdjY domain-containing protein [bacterium]MDA7862712.1 YdjY domain-containing protein [Akkermansiaceae bacterium]MDA8875824.1 YdjY domain-containing protein [Akkermansiaceae bacterium]MDA8967368.1 YdjY domain-containing protein [Akkermansiaceae bacterium]
MRRLTLSLLLLSSPLLLGDEDKTAAPKKPQIKQLSENEYQIGKVTLNKKTREITFGAGVNLVDRPLEYLLVNTKGKVHEALFLTDISPLNLNIAMKLIGFKESKELFEIVNEEYRPTGKFPEVSDEVKKASRVDILVQWDADGKSKTVPINDLIIHSITTQQMAPGPWLYTGSYMHEGKFKAEISGDLFAIYPRQPPLVSYPGKDNLNDDIWFTHPKRMPDEGTVVKIILKPHQP